MLKSTQIKTIHIPVDVAVIADTFEDTPCPNEIIFTPGEIFVNSTVIVPLTPILR